MRDNPTMNLSTLTTNLKPLWRAFTSTPGATAGLGQLLILAGGALLAASTVATLVTATQDADEGLAEPTVPDSPAIDPEFVAHLREHFAGDAEALRRLGELVGEADDHPEG